jgi:hypothetical protein
MPERQIHEQCELCRQFAVVPSAKGMIGGAPRRLVRRVHARRAAEGDLNLLVLFEAVFQAGHVGSAAARVHVSPSAVSHGLGRLRQLFDDPLFLRTPKGVVPTARASELAPPIADILARVRNVMGTVEPFDPATSTRRFTIGASDATSVVLYRRSSLRCGARHLASI